MASAELRYATDYANGLLEHLGAPRLLPALPQVHPALRWAHCGAMWLTGYPGQAAQMSPGRSSQMRARATCGCSARPSTMTRSAVRSERSREAVIRICCSASFCIAPFLAHHVPNSTTRNRCNSSRLRYSPNSR